jgi:creatinine amidohydrolase
MKLALIYVNPVEYHGPHLPLQTDFEISKGLGQALLERMRPHFPQLEITHSIEIHRGCDPAHGPGSEFTKLNDLQAIVVKESKKILEGAKPDLVIFLTFHGAPTHAAAIEAGVRFFAKQGVKVYNPFNQILKKLRDYDPTLADPMLPLIPDEAFRQHYRQHLPADFHGGLFETSVLLHLNAEAVKPLHKNLPDCEDRKISLGWKFLIGFTRAVGLKTFSRDLALGADALGWMKLKSYPGYTGAPRLATPEIGQYFTGVILNDYAEGFLKVVNENHPSPAPILQWTIHF